jgi:hypothetical protein
MEMTKFAVVPAEGHYGDYADVVSTHSTLDAAKRAARGNWQAIKVAEGVRKGDRLPRIDVQPQ